MKKTATFLLKMWGWKIVGGLPKDPKFVIIMAPHTSFWDFIIGKLFLMSVGQEAKVLIKKEFFVFPIRGLLKSLGGIPVDRAKAQNIVQQASDAFFQSKSMALIITPEGTRKANPHWKKGFYYICERAQVPLYAGFLDYKKKEAGIKEKINFSRDYEKDIAHIKSLYVGVNAKYPELFSL